MVDTRENILARLVEIIATVPNIVSVQRNNMDWPVDHTPAALVLDGDETVVTSKTLPLLAEMTPEIAIVDQSEDIGSNLTAFRLELMKRIFADAALNSLTGANGKISYAGCVTGFGWNEKKYGELDIRFTFKYPLKPDDL